MFLFLFFSRRFGSLKIQTNQNKKYKRRRFFEKEISNPHSMSLSLSLSLSLSHSRTHSLTVCFLLQYAAQKEDNNNDGDFEDESPPLDSARSSFSLALKGTLFTELLLS